ncbi:MAG: glycosyltransferase, partial [Proteobacteria bacterium]|nr:glycosyltransferase [Pseudomonadota bacterium]
MVEKFAAIAAFPVTIAENQENLGSTKNFEKAIRLCSGDIIVLSDQDDIWDADKLRYIEDEFIRSPHVGLVFSNGNIVNEELSFLGYTLWDVWGFTNRSKKKCLEGKSFDLLL